MCTFFGSLKGCCVDADFTCYFVQCYHPLRHATFELFSIIALWAPAESMTYNWTNHFCWPPTGHICEPTEHQIYDSLLYTCLQALKQSGPLPGASAKRASIDAKVITTWCFDWNDHNKNYWNMPDAYQVFCKFYSTRSKQHFLGARITEVTIRDTRPSTIIFFKISLNLCSMINVSVRCSLFPVAIVLSTLHYYLLLRWFRSTRFRCCSFLCLVLISLTITFF